MKDRLGEGIARSRFTKPLSHCFFFDNASARVPPPTRRPTKERYANGEHGGSQMEKRTKLKRVELEGI